MGAPSSNLSLPASLTALHQATAFVRQLALDAEFPPRLMPRLDLIVEELFVNITLYAYPRAQMGRIELRCAISSPEHITIEFLDEGVPFNPLGQTPPELDTELDTRASGGLGIFLVQQSSSSIHYRHEHGRNHLTIHLTPDSLAL